MKAIPLLAIAVFLAGCLGPEKIQQKLSFDIAEVQPLLKPGTNTVKGSALFNQVGGGTVTCAGRPVTLIPRSTYADERMQIIYGNLRGGAGVGLLPESDPVSYSNYVSANKQATCNAQGFFQFDELADGEYYIVTNITWGQYGTEGGNLMRSVKVSGGETVDVVLAP